MNQITQLFKDLRRSPYYLGFEGLFEELDNMVQNASKQTIEDFFTAPAFPPFNVKKINDNQYAIEIAVAGFNKENLDVSVIGDKLVITGKSTEQTDTFLYKGLAGRSFTRQFKLANSMKVKGVNLINGLLRVDLEGIKSETVTQKYEIGDGIPK